MTYLSPLAGRGNAPDSRQCQINLSLSLSGPLYPMALTDAEHLAPPSARSRVTARLRGLLTGEHASMRRMAGTAFIIRVASAAVVFLSQILMARWMGGFEYGSYVYVWTWLLLIGDLVHLGLPLTAQRHIPEYTQRGALDLLRGYLIGSRWLTFGLGTAVAIVGAALVHTLEGSLDQHVIMPLYLACAALPFYAFSFMLDGLSRSQDWIALGLMPHSLLRPILILVLIAGAHTMGFPIDATTAMLATAVAVWTTALGQLFVLNGRLARTIAPGGRSYDVMGWFATSLPMIAVWGIYTLLTTTDVLVLQQFRPSDEVAHYYAASKTLTLVTFVYFAVAASAAHRFTAYHVAGDRAGLEGFAAITIRWIFWPSLGALALILALGKPMLWLFGPSFTDAYPVMFVLAIGLLARAAIGPAERLLTMTGHQRICALAYACAFAVNIVGCFVLARPYGGMGVAMATSAAFVVESGLLFLIARRRLGLHLFVWRRKA
jgi:O-antigen/teichoic acid export membrane protein